MPSLTPTPLSALRISSHHIPPYQNFPNTSLNPYPLLIYHSVFPSSASLSARNVEAHLISVGVVKPAWRYTMYQQHHYHSTAHEFLVVVSGSAQLCFGGSVSPENKGKVLADVKKGDAMLVPAGVGHALLQDKDGGFEMVGSYPTHAERWDMCTGEDGEKGGEEWKRIKGLKWFDRDPIYGDEGPAVDLAKGS
ncbi:hypothetical protein CI109_102689 [Kwoniella shandongensis]|uniref:Uncharacterized protein n=1 Tax=Kwoniella shandongensis TaxID=1734106 RepID=A0A5M6BNU2_9TREE|nr:uncharacterized protein CI109_007111 [Kwoniella shandongensis]KAA5524564.1 hypothetical protein CI109_007111 [Kwoniella shandongensis]